MLNVNIFGHSSAVCSMFQHMEETDRVVNKRIKINNSSSISSSWNAIAIQLLHSPEDGSFFSSLTMLASMNSLAGAIEIISWSPMASFCDYTRSPTSPPTILLTSTAPPSSTLLLGLFFAKVHDNKNSNVRNGIRLVHDGVWVCVECWIIPPPFE